MISGYTGQAGNPVNREHMFRLVCETMLANVIAFEEAGVPLQELKQSIGPDGGIIIGPRCRLTNPYGATFL